MLRDLEWQGEVEHVGGSNRRVLEGSVAWEQGGCGEVDYMRKGVGGRDQEGDCCCLIASVRSRV